MSDDHSQQDIFDAIEDIMLERIPFNRVLGLKLASMQTDTASLRLDMRSELVGNFVRGALHGGVISSILDVTGGVVAMLGAIDKMDMPLLDDKLACFEKLGTIDLRVDYLRPGQGEYFVSTGYILRIGKKVAVTRMELHNDKDSLIAVGTGAYIVA